MNRPAFTPRSPAALSLSQALDNSPSLARLAAISDQSNAMLKSVQDVLPAALRPSIKAGPLEEGSWCLLVQGNAAAAKLRQLLPRLQMQLDAQGWVVSTIRLKVLSV